MISEPGATALAAPRVRRSWAVRRIARLVRVERTLRGTAAGRLVRACQVATLALLVLAVSGFVGATNHARGLERAQVATDRVLTVLEVQNALLQADSAVTNAFLVGGLEPPAGREIYESAIAAASATLAELAEGTRDERAEETDEGALISGLNDDLATYTGLIESARVNNRQGLPVGAAYLDQASTLLREEMLTDLARLTDLAGRDASADFATVRWQWWAVGGVALAVFAIGYAQVRVALLTRRRLNRGLVAGSAVLLLSGGIGGIATYFAVDGALTTRLDDYRPTVAVAQSVALATEARSLESFTLIQRGSGQDYEESYADRVERAEARLSVAGSAADPLRGELDEWVEQHARIRELDDSGSWEEAVVLATGQGEDDPTAAFTTFVAGGDEVVATGTEQIESGLNDAARAARLAGWVWAIGGALGALLVWRGTAARREEFR